MKYSHTSLKMALRCMRKWYYRYIRRLEPKEPAAPLVRGREYHELLEYYYKDVTLRVDSPDWLWRYDEKWSTEPAWDVFAIEEEFEVELSVGITVVFKPDLLIRINGEIWIVDHKTTANIPEEYDPYNMTDFQHLLYIGLLRKLGWNVKGFVFNYIRSKEPTMPKLRKDGKIADLRRLDTDYNTLLGFAEEHGLDGDPDVKDKLAIIKMTADRYFQRHFLIVPDHAVDQAMEDAWQSFNTISYQRAAGQYPRHVQPKHAGSQACSKCEFQAICFNDLMGIESDLELLGLVERPRRNT